MMKCAFKVEPRFMCVFALVWLSGEGSVLNGSSVRTSSIPSVHDPVLG